MVEERLLQYRQTFCSFLEKFTNSRWAQFHTRWCAARRQVSKAVSDGSHSSDTWPANPPASQGNHQRCSFPSCCSKPGIDAIHRSHRSVVDSSFGLRGFCNSFSFVIQSQISFSSNTAVHEVRESRAGKGFVNLSLSWFRMRLGVHWGGRKEPDLCGRSLYSCSQQDHWAQPLLAFTKLKQDRRGIRKASTQRVVMQTWSQRMRFIPLLIVGVAFISHINTPQLRYTQLAAYMKAAPKLPGGSRVEPQLRNTPLGVHTVILYIWPCLPIRSKVSSEKQTLSRRDSSHPKAPKIEQWILLYESSWCTQIGRGYRQMNAKEWLRRHHTRACYS